jgi:hypothetical protein
MNTKQSFYLGSNSMVPMVPNGSGNHQSHVIRGLRLVNTIVPKRHTPYLYITAFNHWLCVLLCMVTRDSSKNRCRPLLAWRG